MNEKNLIFEKYLSGGLSEEEIKEFEEKITADTSLKEDFDTYKKTVAFLEHKFTNEKSSKEFTKNLRAISDKHFEKTPAKRFKLWHYGAVASVLLIFGVVFFNNSNPTYDDFVSYNTIDLVVRGAENELLLKSEKAYNAKDFETANTYFNTLLKENPNNTEIQLYKGFSLVELNRFDEAETILESISKGKSVYKYKATWYLALSKLKQKEYALCKKYLEMIPEDAPNYKNVKKLLQKIN